MVRERERARKIGQEAHVSDLFKKVLHPVIRTSLIQAGLDNADEWTTWPNHTILKALACVHPDRRVSAQVPMNIGQGLQNWKFKFDLLQNDLADVIESETAVYHIIEQWTGNLSHYRAMDRESRHLGASLSFLTF